MRVNSGTFGAGLTALLGGLGIAGIIQPLVGITIAVIGAVTMALSVGRREEVAGATARVRRPVVAVTLAVRNLGKLVPSELPFDVQNVGDSAGRFVRLKIYNVGGATVECDEITLLPPNQPPVRVTGRLHEFGIDMTRMFEGGEFKVNWFRAKMRSVVKEVQREVRFRVTVEYSDPAGALYTEQSVLRCSPSLDVSISRD
jgi:hypothetical protein